MVRSSNDQDGQRNENWEYIYIYIYGPEALRSLSVWDFSNDCSALQMKTLLVTLEVATYNMFV